MIFCLPTWPTCCITHLENVRQLNKRRGKKLGFQLSHRQSPGERKKGWGKKYTINTTVKPEVWKILTFVSGIGFSKIFRMTSFILSILVVLIKYLYFMFQCQNKVHISYFSVDDHLYLSTQLCEYVGEDFVINSFSVNKRNSFPKLHIRIYPVQ